ncbi:MAG: tRNA (adenosine(37)-N6)-threonylcarbamoyltransferase complex ATPase subunit type 1 TsaE [Aminivibrio sp.]|jgi:tRNA threonylcarbamoyladenosine biosynthesis protein TsaE
MNKPVSESAPICVIHTRSEEETWRLGALLAKKLSGGITILLLGGLGVGKTAFVRGFCEALGFSRVRSPSFTLVNRYKAGEREIIHSDLYRLEEEDIDDLDLQGEETGKSVLFIEWAERTHFFSDRALLAVHIAAPDMLNHPERRMFEFYAKNPEGRKVFCPLKKIIEEEFAL